MSAVLAIQYIEEANLTWVRTNSGLGPLEDLVSSIKEDGVRKPILIRPDFVVIDGARRIAAAKAAGLDVVPIQWINTWTDIMTYYRPMEPDCRPMDWLDLLDLWSIWFKPLHQEHRAIAASATRRSRTETQDYSSVKSPSYSGYTVDLADLYRVQPATIKLMRDYFKRLFRYKSRFPDFYHGVLAALPTGEAARDLTQCRVLKAVMENLYRGDYTEDQAISVFEERLIAAQTERRPRIRGKVARLDPRSPAISVKVMTNLVELLENVAMQAQQFRNFKIKTDDAWELIRRITIATTELGGVRKRLEASIAAASGEEEEK